MRNRSLLRIVGRCTSCALLVVLLGIGCTVAAAAEKRPAKKSKPTKAASAYEDPVEPGLVRQWEAVLGVSPQGVGRPITDRAAWDAVARAKPFRDVVPAAEKYLKEPIPELPDELYLEFSRTGNRTHFQNALSRRRARFPVLVLAECMENRGRFLGGIEAMIGAICDEKAWTLPAHDRALRNFEGRELDVDLRVAATAWDLATVCWWLGDKLSPAIRNRVADELRRRTFEPYLGAVRSNKPRMGWLRTTNNWNAVCLAGVTGAALAAVEPRAERAYYAAAAQTLIENFLRGFTADGYCSEGMGYWNYGFGHYVMLAETLKQATGGKVDLMDSAHVEEVARFGRRMEILPGLYPAFADCSAGAKPDARLMAFLSRRYEWGLKEVEDRNLLLAAGPSGSLFELGLMAFANSASAAPPREGRAAPLPPRDWFSEAGILICRPEPDQPRAMGVALKGGHNAEHHNHNDVGSFVVARGRGLPLLDPGSEVYTARTFSSRRYESNVLNSFGHPVPRVAGTLQRPGRDAAAKVLTTSFSQQTDTLVLDLRAAYAVKTLKSLVRSFTYSRRGLGSLTVADAVEFDLPQAFGTALITYSKWKRIAANRLRVGEGDEAVDVEIGTGGTAFELRPEEIQEDVRADRKPVRLGIDLAAPLKQATITLKITPTAP